MLDPPQIIGTAYITGASASIGPVRTVHCPIPTGVQEGDLLIFTTAFVNGSGDNFEFATDPWVDSHWTHLAGQITGNTLHAGTLGTSVWAATYSTDLELGFRVQPDTMGERRIMPVCVAIRGASSIDDIVVGTLADRTTYGTSTTTVAPSIVATAENTLVLGIFTERTNAAETDVTSVSGATRHSFYYDTTSTSIETVTVTTEVVETPSTSGDTTVTYLNPHASNSYGIHLGIIPFGAGPPPNIAPTADAGTDQTVRINDLVQLDGTSSLDPDGGIAGYLWTQLSGPPISLLDANTARPTFIAPTSLGDITLQLKVTDSGGANDTDTVTITVTDRTLAIIGDSLVERDDNDTSGTREDETRNLLESAGWGSGSVYWYGREGKQLLVADSNTKTTIDIIDEAILDLGSIDQLVISLGTNDVALTPTEFGDAVESILDHCEQQNIGEVFWMGLSFWDPASTDATTYNPILEEKVNARPFAKYLNWNAAVHTSHDDADWIYPTDSIHMTTQGYAKRDAYMITALQAPPIPEIVDTIFLTGSGTATIGPENFVTLTLPVDIQEDDLILGVFAYISASGEGFLRAVRPAAAEDWTYISGQREGETQHAGTLAFSVWGARYAPGLSLDFDTNIIDGRIMLGTVIIRGAGDIDDILAGVLADRQPHATSTTTVAPSITTPVPSMLSIGLFAERTFATEADVVSVSGAPKIDFWYDATNASQETIAITAEKHAMPGPTGDTVVTYPNSQEQNAYGMHLGIPPAFTPPVIPQIIGTPTTYETSSGLTQFTIDVPTIDGGLQLDDALVMVVRGQSTISDVDFTNAAFTRLGPDFEPNSAEGRIIGLHAHRVTVPESEPVSYTFTGDATAPGRIVATMFVVRSLDHDNPVIAHSSTYRGTNSVSENWVEVETYLVNHPGLSVGFGSAEMLAPGNHVPSVTPTDYEEVQFITTSTDTNVSRTVLWVGQQESTAAASSAYWQWENSTAESAQTITLRGTSITPTLPPDNVPMIVGTPTKTSGSGWTEQTLAVPSDTPEGLQAGDILVAILRGQSSISDIDFTNPVFTRQGPAFVPNSVGGRMLGLFTHVITSPGAEPPSYTFSAPDTAAAGRITGVMFVLRGADWEDPISGFSSSYVGTSITSGRRVEDFAIENPSLVIFYGGNECTSPNPHTPTGVPLGFTEVVTNSTSENTDTSRTALWVGQQGVADVATVDADITWANTAGHSAQAVAFRAGSGLAPTPEGLTAYDGTGSEVKVFYTTDSEGSHVAPKELIAIPSGFSNVEDALATPGFTCGHRGNSTRYAEMSLYAYTQTAARGYGMLEVSLTRTSDGVWFGLHDQYLDRTSGVTGNLDPKNMTWAQVQAYQNIHGSQGIPRPYMRWEEVVEAYGKTHVLMVDPKYHQSSHRAEFLSMLANDVGTSRAFVKYHYSSTSLGNAAQAAGFQTWGFYYASDLNTDPDIVTNTHSAWTILGLDWTASQTHWDHITSFGKPVIGHIISSQEAYDTVIAKGATGAQVSASHLVGAVGPKLPGGA